MQAWFVLQPVAQYNKSTKVKRCHICWVYQHCCWRYVYTSVIHIKWL